MSLKSIPPHLVQRYAIELEHAWPALTEIGRAHV